MSKAIPNLVSETIQKGVSHSIEFHRCHDLGMQIHSVTLSTTRQKECSEGLTSTSVIPNPYQRCTKIFGNVQRNRLTRWAAAIVGRNPNSIDRTEIEFEYRCCFTAAQPGMYMLQPGSLVGSRIREPSRKDGDDTRAGVLSDEDATDFRNIEKPTVVLLRLESS